MNTIWSRRVISFCYEYCVSFKSYLSRVQIVFTFWLPSTLHVKNAEPPNDTVTSLGSSLNLNSSEIPNRTTINR